MPSFGAKSQVILAELHPLLRRVFEHSIARSIQDFSLTCGYRGEADQEDAFRRGATKAPYLQSAHNYKPSVAVDVLPYPFKGWNDKDIHKELKVIAGVVLGVAKEFKIPVRWGADWNMNGRTDDEKFVDSPHFELHPWRSFTKA